MFCSRAWLLLTPAAGARASISYVPAGSVIWFDASGDPPRSFSKVVLRTRGRHAPEVNAPPPVLVACCSCTCRTGIVWRGAESVLPETDRPYPIVISLGAAADPVGFPNSLAAATFWILP